MKAVFELPRGHVDLMCVQCGQIYEYFNWHGRALPVCPVCGALEYKRAYVSMPQYRVVGLEQIYARDPVEGEWVRYFMENQPSKKRSFTDSEYRALAIKWEANSGERIDWRDLKKDLETRVYGVSPIGSKPNKEGTSDAG